MRYIISGKNIDITSGLREAVESKIGKLERYFSPDTEVQVTMSVEKGRQKIEVTIPVKGTIIRAEQDSSDMYVSIDLVEEIIERQIKKYKTKLIDKKQSALSFSEAFLQEETTHEETINIVKTKRFAMKPMDPEEMPDSYKLLLPDMHIFGYGGWTFSDEAGNEIGNLSFDVFIGHGATVKSAGPAPDTIYLYKDLTEHYRTEYPESGVRTVVVSYKVSAN